MTTKRSYDCNVCDTPIRDGNGRGFNFGSERVNWEKLSHTENHICDHCIKILKASFKDSGIIEQFGE